MSLNRNWPASMTSCPWLYTPLRDSGKCFFPAIWKNGFTWTHLHSLTMTWTWPQSCFSLSHGQSALCLTSTSLFPDWHIHNRPILIQSIMGYLALAWDHVNYSLCSPHPYNGLWLCNGVGCRKGKDWDHSRIWLNLPGRHVQFRARVFHCVVFWALNDITCTEKAPWKQACIGEKWPTANTGICIVLAWQFCWQHCV